LLKWNLQIAAAHCERRRLPGGHKPPLQNTHCLCAQKQKGRLVAVPISTMSPHRLIFRRSSGRIRAPGFFVTRRRDVGTDPA